jgi:hypothetical protein
MDDATRALEEAIATVETGEQHFARQRLLLATVGRTRRTADKLGAAKAVLHAMEESQALRVTRVELLRATGIERKVDVSIVVSLSMEDGRNYSREWEQRGLRGRWARALVSNGILTLAHLREATDHQLLCLPAVGRRGLRQICELVGRKPPGNEKSPEERQAEFERDWRAKVGDEAFERILDAVVDMAGDALDRPNVAAGQALWAAARRRRVAPRKR